MAPRGGTVAVSSYAGVHHDVEAPIDADNNGVFFLNTFLRNDQIADGLAYTLFYGEKIIEPVDLGWMSGTRATLRNLGTGLNMTGMTPDGRPLISADQDTINKAISDAALPANLKMVAGFGSAHAVAVHFAFGDGSVRPLLESMDLQTLQLLAHRADGKMIELDF